MKDKKGKALVMKLIDDLISDDDETVDERTRPVEKDNSDPDSQAATRLSDSSDKTNRSEVLELDVGEEPEADETVRIPDVPARAKAKSAAKSQPPGKAGATLTRTHNTDDSTEVTGDAEHSEHSIKSTVGRPTALRGGVFSSPTEAALATSENLRIAQSRILELEQEVERLRVENEQLAAAGETLRRRGDEAASKVTQLEDKLEQTVENSNQEVQLMREGLAQKEQEARQLRNKLEETEARISTNIKKIRVRERELENRLELVKMEGQALIRSKDEIILDLKRQLDQLTIEMDNYRNKGQELNRVLSEKQDLLRRTVKALRIALSMLEGDEAAQPPTKKVKSG